MPEAVFNPTKLIATIPRAGRANPDWCILKACAEFRQYTTSMHEKKNYFHHESKFGASPDPAAGKKS